MKLSCSRVYLDDDVAIIVVSQRAGQFIVGHVLSVLSVAPESRQRCRSDDSELAVAAFPDNHLVVVVRASTPELPRSVVDVLTGVTEQFQQELPQLNVTLRPTNDYNNNNSSSSNNYNNKFYSAEV